MSDTTKQSTETTMGSSVSFTFVINLALNTSMALIWSMMNMLQIMVHMPLINMAFPSNALLLSLMLLEVANFDMLPHEIVSNYMYEFNTEAPLTNVRF